MGSPSVFLWDCSSAGTVVNMFLRFADDHCMRWMEEYHQFRDQYPPPIPEEGTPSTSNTPQPGHMYNNIPPHMQPASALQLGACSAGENLPYSNPDLPADLFTCCLTTPIQTSLLCHMLKTGTKNKFPPNIIDEIPGKLTDRRTLLGELNWIFTAITDTIAWSALPCETFQKLFRQDLLIASLFRSFLLAERIMFENGCHVVSQPSLPSTRSHPCWEYWDLTLDLCLSNLYNLLTEKGSSIMQMGGSWFVPTSMRHNRLIELPIFSYADSEYAYSRFFIEQLQAFEVWLKFGSDKNRPPQQLPVLLQVLLSQVHRIRALELLAKFVDLGSWAVMAALSVGIFPYVLKLLQCGTRELRPSLAFIWAKILSVDLLCPLGDRTVLYSNVDKYACQNELIKEKGYSYFIQILNDPSVGSRLKIVPAFVLATLIYNNYKPAQERLIGNDYIHLCIELLSNSQVMKCRMLCLWLLIGLGRLWADYDKARWMAIRSVAYERVEEFLNDDVPEVRAAAVYALGCFVHNRSRHSEHATTIDNEVCDTICGKCTYDGSVLVRAELAVAIQWFLIDFEIRFTELSLELDRKINPTKIVNRLPSSLEIDAEDEPPIRLLAPESSALKKSLSSFSSILSYPRKTRDKIMANEQAMPDPDAEDNDPFERIWLSVLHLCFDPFKNVAEMGMKLVGHIWNVAKSSETSKQKAISSTINAISRDNDDATSSASVRFMIGSPGVTTNGQATRKLSAIENTLAQMRQCSSMADMVTNGLIETSTNFTPKRNLYGTQSGRYKVEEAHDAESPIKPIVTTQFVDWCSKTFTQPIYKTIYEEQSSSTSTRNCMVDSDTPFTVAFPSDWALHTYEGLKQKSQKDLEILKSKKARCETQFVHFRNERTVTSATWSFLRPYIYVCDGEKVSVYNSSREHYLTPNVCDFVAYKETLLNDAIIDLMVANGLAHELLITGTRNGLIQVWNPTFSPHGHEMLSSPKLVTSAYLLNDVPRIASKKGHNTLYCWDQNHGQIVCGGNIRICRIWDAWCEKATLDLVLKSKSSSGNITTSLTADLSANMVATGFGDGTLAVYDVRLPPDECQIMRLRDFKAPIIGSSFLDGQFLIAGSRDGDIKIYEPRMFHESTVEFNVLDSPLGDESSKASSVSLMHIQQSGKLVACALNDSTVRIYDALGTACLSKNRYSPIIASRGTPSDISSLSPTAMRFHQSKVMLGIATTDNCFAAYGLPSLDQVIDGKRL
ncbi:target of rapamycin complex 1 subunit mip1 [Ditylenchus destructor]|nr:target of rapamycin complex 1 subunit mip1 [Ditylenchus destructor]